MVKKIGSRAEVFHGNANQTAGGLCKKDLFKDKHGNIKSKKASSRAKKNKNLGGHLKQKGSGCFDYTKKVKVQMGGGKKKKDVELEKHIFIFSDGMSTFTLPPKYQSAKLNYKCKCPFCNILPHTYADHVEYKELVIPEKDMKPSKADSKKTSKKKSKKSQKGAGFGSLIGKLASKAKTMGPAMKTMASKGTKMGQKFATNAQKVGQKLQKFDVDKAMNRLDQASQMVDQASQVVGQTAQAVGQIQQQGQMLGQQVGQLGQQVMATPNMMAQSVRQPMMYQQPMRQPMYRRGGKKSTKK